MDITDKFLPNEKFLKKYDHITIDGKTGFSVVVTNLRIFMANKYEMWDIQTDKIDYLGRAFVPRYDYGWKSGIIRIVYAFICCKTIHKN
ncbi:MAG: hypothetical protein CXT75_08440 [Methanobacteriota archaeon]|nr:MAG: hypothetical protein CXT75_08440 [Euryarchaeota archaeon]